MRRWLGVLSLTLAMAGCGTTAGPVATLGVGTSPDAAPNVPTVQAAGAAAAASVAPGVTVSGPAMSATPSGDATAPDASVPAKGSPVGILDTAGDPAVDDTRRMTAEDDGPDDPPDLVAKQMSTQDVASDLVSDRLPWGVVVSDRGAHYATIAWATEVPTRGKVEYGRSFGFDQHGFTDSATDDVPACYHKLTLTNLRRWTGYEYRVTAIDALGLTFPEKERSFRTLFWAWR